MATTNEVRQVDESSTNKAIQTDDSAVSWAAIFAGAAATAALSLILILLGIGFGLSVVSPWVHSGASATAITVGAIIWIITTSIIAGGLGGYIAGRLRTKWATTVDRDEVFFRDTAHGFLAWSVSMLVTAALLAAAIGWIVSGATQAGASVAGGIATTAAGADLRESDSDSGLLNYYIDSLFRKDTNASPDAIRDGDAGSAKVGPEIARIFMNSIRTGNLQREDLRYVSQLVAQRTELTPVEAERRVQEAFTRVQKELRKAETTAREAADQARKASAYTARWLFVALLISAFVACVTAIFGGWQRDKYSSDTYNQPLRR